MILERLEQIRVRFEDVRELLSNPGVLADQKRYAQLSREFRQLESLMEVRKEYLGTLSGLDEARQVMQQEKDPELREMAKEELNLLEPRMEELLKTLRLMLLPKKPEDAKNAIVEIRAGTGGDEAALFAGDLFRMYSKFIERRGWTMEVVDANEGTMGGYKEMVFNVFGNGAYGELKFESGVHRVQRVPQTETQGRIHTSAASVAVFPEAEEFDVVIDMNDVRKDTFCSSGPGGQSVNTTYSAIRLTHLPTGIVAQCQDEKSQIKNLEKALKVLRSRIYEMELEKVRAAEDQMRKTMVSTGDRSAKIRTYNYPQSRVTDHRIGLTLYQLEAVLAGDIQPFLEALQLEEHADALNELQ
jgi:peptide chain release factor 1